MSHFITHSLLARALDWVGGHAWEGRGARACPMGGALRGRLREEDEFPFAFIRGMKQGQKSEAFLFGRSLREELARIGTKLVWDSRFRI